MYHKIIFALWILWGIKPLSAQIDGDNIFAQTQIITIELQFSQPGYWDSLVANYNTKDYMRADLTLTDSTGTYTFDDVGVRLKGNSSYGHPHNKKSFKIDFNEYVKGQNYDGLKKLNFSNGFKDPTLMREKIFFDVCREAGVPAPRANFANVYCNDTLKGFFTVIEQIDDQFLDWRIGDDDGNLFKAGDNFGGGPGSPPGDEADLVYYGTAQSAYEDRYELKTNETENDWSDLIQFIDFINNSSSSDFENQLGNKLELTEFLRSAALDNLFSNLDSYTGSSRNYYLYHNLSTDKWEWIKWDGNEAFGSYRMGGPAGGPDLIALPLKYRAPNRPLLERIFNSPVLYPQYLTELCSITQNYFHPAYLNSKILACKSLIQSSVYADGNKMYSNADFDTNVANNLVVSGGPMGMTIYGLQSFVQQRSSYVSGAVDCTLYTDIADAFAEASLLYPNPAAGSTLISWQNIPLQSLRLIDVMGQELYRESVNGKTEVELDLSRLSAGIYLIVLQGENQKLVQKLWVSP
jgi:hypothetical protein